MALNGTNGTNGTKGANPTAGSNGGAGSYTSSGQVNAPSVTVLSTGGTGGTGGKNTGTGAGAKGGNGGNSTVTIDGDIFKPTANTPFIVSGTATGGAGGLGGAGNPSGATGNGGNAVVDISGNIISTSVVVPVIEIDAFAHGGAGAKSGNASATVNGNIVTYTNNKSAVDVNLVATADIVGADDPSHNGDSAYGTKTATVNGNILSGNIDGVVLEADAQYSNGTASITGNIVTTKPANTGNVSLFATGQHISINGNILSLGKQELDISLNELGPIYSASLSGNIFTGTGTNTLVLADSAVPGPNPIADSAVINLATGAFLFDGQSNILSGFQNITLMGDIGAKLTGTSGNNTLDASSNSGNVTFMGNGGTDTLNGGTGLNVAEFAGLETQYAVNLTGGNGTVVGGPVGNTSNDTLTNIQRLKFLAPSHVSDVDNNGAGDLIFQNPNNGNIQVRLEDPASTLPNITGVGMAWRAIGTGQFTADTNRDASILLQNTNNGKLEIISNITGTPTTTAVTGVTPTAFSGWTAITAGDFNGDAASDVLLQNFTTGAVEIAFMNTSFGEPIGQVDSVSSVTTPGAGWNAISSGDLNGDGDSDILWQNSTSGAIDVSLMNGANGTPTSVGSAAGFTAVGTGDFNGDGDSDILLRNNTTGSAEIWFMNGATRVGSPLDITAPTGYTLMGAEDVNKDGFSDLLWRDSSNDVKVTEMTTGGTVLGTFNLTSPNSSFALVASTGGG